MRGDGAYLAHPLNLAITVVRERKNGRPLHDAEIVDQFFVCVERPDSGHRIDNQIDLSDYVGLRVAEVIAGDRTSNPTHP